MRREDEKGVFAVGNSTRYGMPRKRLWWFNGTPKLDKADLWEDVEAGLESINPIRPKGNKIIGQSG